LAVSDQPPSAPAEELELDVVRVAEGEHRIRRVVELFHTGVLDSHLVEPCGPLVEILTLFDDELEMIESRPMLVNSSPGLAAGPTRHSTNSLIGSTRQM
jgi:hypothetical protein